MFGHKRIYHLRKKQSKYLISKIWTFAITLFIALHLILLIPPFEGPHYGKIVVIQQGIEFEASDLRKDSMLRTFRSSRILMGSPKEAYHLSVLSKSIAYNVHVFNDYLQLVLASLVFDR